MLDFLKTHQLNIMLFMSGICGILAVLTLMTKTLSSRRRRILALLEAAAMLLLIADRYAYIYRGDPSTLGFWMVRISNFLV
ncbi:MAG: diguanylate cyclase, partial [Clostridia bacterium]|nr:diguanylate cyclase [Clostridia bacterium]